MKNLILAIVGSFSIVLDVNASIINGDFELGNSGFTSQYSYANLNTTEGEYTVRSDPQNWNSAFFSMPDHTSGTGNMMVVNGAPIGNLVVWEQTVAVDAFTSYGFSAWVSSAVADGPANLIVKINGTTLSSSFLAPSITGTWENLIRTWNSESTSSATIQILDINTAIFPNDFYLDDLALTAVPLPAPFWLLGSGIVGLLAIRKRAYN